MMCPHIDPSNLPRSRNLVFEKSSFFTRSAGATLPTPRQVRLDAAHWNDESRIHSSRPPPVLYKDLKLLVKYGRQITQAEGQCLWAIHHHLNACVPVPEIFGWSEDADEVFLYMELIDGDTLEHRWDSLSDIEREKLCAELHHMTEAWRGLQQVSTPAFVGERLLFPKPQHLTGYAVDVTS